MHAGGPPSKELSRVCRKAFYCMPLGGSPQGPATCVRNQCAGLRPMTGPTQGSFAVTDTDHQPLPIVVLDTNVLLDWLVFDDPRCTALRTELRAPRRLRWMATPAMRAELAHVLARGGLAAWEPNLQQIWALWDAHSIIVPAPDLSLGKVKVPRCADPADQKFVDLAIAVGAQWLLSRDRAVLKMRRRLGALGIQVAPPERLDLANGLD
jgi:predicted nucleic acid-binding protein